MLFLEVVTWISIFASPIILHRLGYKQLSLFNVIFLVLLLVANYFPTLFTQSEYIFKISFIISALFFFTAIILQAKKKRIKYLYMDSLLAIYLIGFFFNQKNVTIDGIVGISTLFAIPIVIGLFLVIHFVQFITKKSK
ncbi:MAG: hypothetical protein ACI35O_13770 [Bacillaceae bacterium]